MDENKTSGNSADVSIDCCGLFCPMPVINAQKALEKMTSGQILEVMATDDGVESDFTLFCKSRKMKLLKLQKDGEFYCIHIQKN